MTLNPEFRVSTGVRPPTVNYLAARHWATVKNLLDPWRDATRIGLTDWRHVQYQRGEIGFYPVYPKGTLPDTDGLAKVYKVITDTIIEVGMLPDDNPPHRSQRTHDPVRNPKAEHPLILVEVLPLEPAAGHGPGECDCRATYENAKRQALLTKAGITKGERNGN